MKVEAQPAFVLHSQPYKETSLLLECLSRDYGRVALVARGARRPRAEIRGQILPFVPLVVDWFGKSELRTLAQVEWLGGVPQLSGLPLLSGFYLNELLLRLLARDDPHEAVFTAYQQAIIGLACGEIGAVSWVLRRFELALLTGLGYAPNLTHQAGGVIPIAPEQQYCFIAGHGAEPLPLVLPVDLPETGYQCLVSGTTLLALAHDQLQQRWVLQEAKVLLRTLLDAVLGTVPLTSRRVLHAVHEPRTRVWPVMPA